MAATNGNKVGKLCDRLDLLLGWCLLFLLVFAPWAFGGTTWWSSNLIALIGWICGGIAITIEIFLCRGRVRTNPLWHRKSTVGISIRFITVTLLVFILASAINSAADAEKSRAGVKLLYHDFIRWIPHSYDGQRTLRAWFKYSGVAFTGFAVDRWISFRSGGTESPELEGRRSQRSASVWPRKVRRFLWVLSISSGLLAMVSIGQKISGTDRLLFLKPRVMPNGTVSAQSSFGPFPYQGNGAEYFNLVWPLVLGFWWCERKSHWETTGMRPHYGTSAQVLLPFFVAVMVGGEFMTNSRGGMAICAAEILAVATVIFWRGRALPIAMRLGIVSFVSISLALVSASGWKTGWVKILRSAEGWEERKQLADHARHMIPDFQPFGCGAEAFGAVNALYTDPNEGMWEAMVHNDWVETRLSLGNVGFGLVVGLLIAWLLGWILGPWKNLPRDFSLFIAISLFGMLLHARFDLPFQISSLLLLFVMLASLAAQCPFPWSSKDPIGR